MKRQFESQDIAKMKETYVNLIHQNFDSLKLKLFVDMYLNKQKPLSQRFYIEQEQQVTTTEDIRLEILKKGTKQVRNSFIKDLDL